MSNLGQFINENNLALANLKFDFSLMKVEAPAEFSGLGSALSLRRRVDAEEGQPHRTARRLGSLFEQLVPSTPKLITAFGLRSSEIMETPGINPMGSTTSGPFHSFIGADGTAMWAAATSGIPALAVYLLACFLARTWDAKEAISIWSELCAERRREIERGFRGNHAISESSLLSLNHEISRNDLATWDASARAWLRSADQAKTKEKDQLMLIFKNVQLPFDSSGSTYSKVIESWRHAMLGLENLLCGKPQTILNNAVLVAMSAWHLYPDLIVLDKQTKNVKFADKYTHPGGVGTIDIHRAEPLKTEEGTQWSLLLSHLSYYGGPVQVQSSLDSTRVSMSQLHLVALGTIFDSWQIKRKDIYAVAKWFVVIWDYVRKADSLASIWKKGIPASLEWLGHLTEAARILLSSQGTPESDALQLVSYGQRRAKSFLGDPLASASPFFGLTHESVLASLAERDEGERCVTYLRQRARITGMQNGDAFILHVWEDVGGYWTEVISAVPHVRASQERSLNGTSYIVESVHTRWYQFRFRQYGFQDTPQESHVDEAFRAFLYATHSRGEQATEISDVPKLKEEDGVEGTIEWTKAPAIFRWAKSTGSGDSSESGARYIKCPSLLDSGQPCRCLDCPPDMTAVGTAPNLFRRLLKLGPYTLCVNKGLRYQSGDTGLRIPGEEYLDPQRSIEWFLKVKIEASILHDYLQHIVQGSTSESGMQYPHLATKSTFAFMIARLSHLGEDRIRALRALTLATQLYKDMEGATISLKLVDHSLAKALWLPRSRSDTLNRQNAFACIANLERGDMQIAPEVFEQTIAVASENSIYVTAILLSDPFDKVPASSIRHIVGNVGRPGITLLVCPFEPQIRPLSNEYNVVTHALYDGRREDNFGGTSLQLRFTEWSMPINVHGSRTIDQTAHLVEAVISVQDAGKWVADLDVLCIDFSILKLQLEDKCPGHSQDETDYEYTSLDSWEEFLDAPSSIGVFRAHGNWAARLAAVSILSQQGQHHTMGLFGPEQACLKCLEYACRASSGSLSEYESALPSFCID